jgi:hypothetical protein
VHEQKEAYSVPALFFLLLIILAGSAGWFAVRAYFGEREAAKYSDELRRAREEREVIARGFNKVENGLYAARTTISGLRDDVDRIADASNRRIGTLRDAIAALRETEEIVEDMERRLYRFERAYGADDSFIGAAVDGAE